MAGSISALRRIDNSELKSVCGSFYILKLSLRHTELVIKSHVSLIRWISDDVSDLAYILSMTSIILFDFLIFGLTIGRTLHTLKVQPELRTLSPLHVLLMRDGKRLYVPKSFYPDTDGVGPDNREHVFLVSK